MTTYTLEQITQMRGQPVYDSSGDKIGSVDDIYYDDETRDPEWVGISSGMIFKSHRLVPLRTASMFQGGIRVPYDKELIESTPEINDEHISVASEQQLYDIYELREPGYSGQSPQTGNVPVGQSQSDMRRRMNSDQSMQRPSGDQSTITRSEEEMRVGKRQTEAGHVHLRKWVDTERETQTVPLRRETAEVAREQINRPASGAEFGEQEVDVPLQQEQPVVEKQAVAKERISVQKNEETVNQDVSADLRKERVETDGDIENDPGNMHQ